MFVYKILGDRRCLQTWCPVPRISRSYHWWRLHCCRQSHQQHHNSILAYTLLIESSWEPQFLSGSAMLERDLTKGGMSVCLSVTRWYWLKTNDGRITLFSPSCSPGTLRFQYQLSYPRSQRNPLARASNETEFIISWKLQKIGIELQWKTNRKSHKCFRLVTNFDDLEGPYPIQLFWGVLRSSGLDTDCQRQRVVSGL